MVSELRKKFNDQFTQGRYEAFLQELNHTYKYPTDFRVAETPLFLSEILTTELVKASYEVFSALQTDEFTSHASSALPTDMTVPNESARPTFIQFDFAICKDERGDFVPQLIELQSFPSLFCYQPFLAECYRHHFSIPGDYTPYFTGLTDESYTDLLRRVLQGDCGAENVVLLEIEPEKQKTRIDFACTEAALGIKSVCVTEVIKRKGKLFYRWDGREIPIERIYNRVVFDELSRKNPQTSFKFTDDLDVHWVGHPNWYFKISKHTLPFLKSRYTPPCYFLSDLREYPADLENYVLKPMFSFAGLGVEIDLSRDLLDGIKTRDNYILQRKVEYAPVVETPDGYSKAEIRMMFLWHDAPMLVMNLVRMSKGKMMGVDYNKDKTWVGSSIAFHP